MIGNQEMQDRYWMFTRSNGVYYLQDKYTKRQESLHTKDKIFAKRLLNARNQAAEQTGINIALAKAFLSSKSSDITCRTWLDLMNDMAAGYQGPTLRRWQTVVKSAPFKLLHKLHLIQTDGSHFMEVLRHPRAGNYTNKALRIMQNRAMDLGWLLCPVLSRRAWPKLIKQPKRGITAAEHEKLIASEKNPEWKLYLQMLWETGGSQTDIANLHSSNIDHLNKRIIYQRIKLRNRNSENAVIAIGKRLEAILAQLPNEGWLFPTLHLRTETNRSSRFRKRCINQKITGVTLHSYRYAWAERAQVSGMPMREAMAHLGHMSKTIHQAYAAKAENVTLPLEFYEEQRNQKIVQFQKEIQAA
jgi:integrase